MARARGDKEYILPHKGLNTEANLLHFPIEHSPDLNNMELDFNPQMVRPRKGLSSSGLARLVATVVKGSHDVAISSFLWRGVAEDPSINLVVVQAAEFLYFFDVDLLEDPSQAIHTESYDLSNSLSGTVKGTLGLLQSNRVVMANVKGKLLVTAESIDPVIITWNTTTNLIEPVSLTLKIRDMFGIEDGLEIDERPASLSDDHKYNLLNQGWYKQRRDTAGSATEVDPIVKFDAITGDFPSNADIVWIGMVEDQGDLIFDPEWLKDQTFGSSPAARGHYVVDAFNIDRAAVIATPTSSGSTSGGSWNQGGGNGISIGGGVSQGTGPLP